MGKKKTCPQCGAKASKTEGTGAAGGQSVNKIAFIILALLFGSIGIHRFYEGKILSGVLFLLFCWTFIPSILALIELIIAIFTKSDNGRLPVPEDKFFI